MANKQQQQKHVAKCLGTQKPNSFTEPQQPCGRVLRSLDHVARQARAKSRLVLAQDKPTHDHTAVASVLSIHAYTHLYTHTRRCAQVRERQSYKLCSSRVQSVQRIQQTFEDLAAGSYVHKMKTTTTTQLLVVCVVSAALDGTAIRRNVAFCAHQTHTHASKP